MSREKHLSRIRQQWKHRTLTVGVGSRPGKLLMDRDSGWIVLQSQSQSASINLTILRQHLWDVSPLPGISVISGALDLGQSEESVRPWCVVCQIYIFVMCGVGVGSSPVLSQPWARTSGSPEAGKQSPWHTGLCLKVINGICFAAAWNSCKKMPGEWLPCQFHPATTRHWI